ncbi:MAG: extracellular solute-binding protein [Nocardioides sp.]|nr:extracellular solute-binding protein [Nocardioides sp.]
MHVPRRSRGVTRFPGGRSVRRLSATFAALATAAALLSACSSSGKTTLVWYINPDTGGQAVIAKSCSTDQYTIKTQVLPTDAGQQRVQLARRLAAGDSGIDLMSIDPAYTAEFAAANFVVPVPQSVEAQLPHAFKGAVTASTWNNHLVVAPFWSNVQALWYRKSFAQKAGLDMSKPVTWDQIITAAADHGGTVGVQANKYEGYVVWINALVMGAGGNIVTNPGAGVNANIDINSQAGVTAANIINKLAHSKAAEPDLSVSNEGTVLAPFATSAGAFQVNWTFIYQNYSSDKTTLNDMGWAMYPESVAGKPSRPPYGGIGIGVSSTSNHIADDWKAVECITSPQNQGQYAVSSGNMPSSAAGYQFPALQKAYPASLLQLFQKSVNAAGPRPLSPYWSDISGAIQSTWHPADSVTSSTPASSQTFIQQVLEGKKLL